MRKNQAMRIFSRPGRHHVAVLVRHGLLPIEAGIVHRLFGQARSADGELLYEVVTCALEPGEISTDTDFTINVAHGPEALDEADTVILPAADEDYGERPHAPSRRLWPRPSRASRRTRAWPRSAPARSCSPRPGSWTGAA